MAGHDQSDEQFIAAAIEQDLRATAAAFGGQVSATSDLEEFIRRTKAAEQERKRRAADPRTVDQIRDELGQMLQRFYEAQWYGTPEQIKQVADEIGPVFAREMDRVAVWPPAVRAGDFIRAAGYNPYDGEPDAVTGIVEEATYTDHPSYNWPYERRSGVNFAISQPPRAGVEEEGICKDVFVLEEDRVVVLPAPVDRGRPAWLDQPTPTETAKLRPTQATDRPAHPTATSASPPADESKAHQQPSSSEKSAYTTTEPSANPLQHSSQEGSPAPDTGPALAAGLARLSYPTPATPAVTPPPRPTGPTGTPRPHGRSRHR